MVTRRQLRYPGPDGLLQGGKLINALDVSDEGVRRCIQVPNSRPHGLRWVVALTKAPEPHKQVLGASLATKMLGRGGKQAPTS